MDTILNAAYEMFLWFCFIALVAAWTAKGRKRKT